MERACVAVEPLFERHLLRQSIRVVCEHQPPRLRLRVGGTLRLVTEVNNRVVTTFAAITLPCELHPVVEHHEPPVLALEQHRRGVRQPAHAWPESPHAQPLVLRGVAPAAFRHRHQGRGNEVVAVNIRTASGGVVDEERVGALQLRRRPQLVGVDLHEHTRGVDRVCGCVHHGRLVCP